MGRKSIIHSFFHFHRIWGWTPLVASREGGAADLMGWSLARTGLSFMVGGCRCSPHGGTMCRSRPNKTNPEMWARYKMPFMENLPSLPVVAQLTPQSVLGLFTSIACNWRTYMAIVTSASWSIPHSVEDKLFQKTFQGVASSTLAVQEKCPLSHLLLLWPKQVQKEPKKE